VMSLARYRRQGQPQQKIRPEHLDRAAYVLLGSSANVQVRMGVVCGGRC